MFHMDQCKHVATLMGIYFRLETSTDDEIRLQYDSMRSIPYQSDVGSLMYAMIATRPDLPYAVGLVCRSISNPLIEHWRALKWILRYINGSLSMKPCYRNEGEFTERIL